jgi:hypothetical protein
LTKLEELENRVEALASKEPKKNENAVYLTIVGELSDEEKSSLAHAIIGAEKAGTDPNMETWLATRPQDEQAVVRKVASRFKELKQEGKES